MLAIRVDVKGGQQVAVPGDDAGVLELGERVVAAEEGLPPEKQFPRLDLIRQRVTAGKVGLTQFIRASANGSAVSVSVEQGMADCKVIVQKIVKGLSYHHMEELPKVKLWGINVSQTAHGPRVQTPTTQVDMLKMLPIYIAREQGLPAAERLPEPPLARVIAAHQALLSALEQRSTANTEQEQGYLLRTVESKALLNLLLLAAHYHVIVDFEGKVDARLQSLGFNVVAVPAKPMKPVKSNGETPAT